MMEGAPDKSETLYREAFETAKRDSPIETRQILQLLLTATRPLTLTEVRFALAFCEQDYKSESDVGNSPSFIESDEEMDRLHRAWTRGLTETRPQPGIQLSGSNESSPGEVDFVHSSVKEFLLKHDGLAIFSDSGESTPDVLQDGHYQLSKSCLNYLQTEEVLQSCRDLPEANTAGIASSAEIFKSLCESHPFLQYSLLSVFHHIKAAELDQTPSSGGTHGHLFKQMVTVFPTWRYLHDLYNKSSFHEVHGPKTEVVHLAVEYGMKEWVVSFLNDGGDVNIEGGRFGTMIEAAAALGQEDVVDILIQSGADCEREGGRFGFPLHAACWQGNQKIVKALLDQGCDVNIRGYEYANPLQAAACSPNGTAELVYTLLDANADIHQRGGRHGSVLQAAAFKGDYPIVECLVLRGAEINVVAGEHGTALGAAAFQGHTEIVNLLLEHGAETSIDAGDCGSPIWCAAYNEHKEILRTLLAHESQLSSSQIDEQAQKTLQEASHAKSFYKATERGDVEQVRQFLQDGLDPNVRGGDFSSALHMATIAGHTAIVDVLVSDTRTKVNIRDSKLRTPLWHAASNGNLHIVKRLLDIPEIDCQCMSDTQRNLLWYPACFGFNEIARLIYQRGIDPHKADCSGKSPYMMAVQEERKEILLIFERET